MISNIVFDLGQVLLSYDPRRYLEKLYADPIKRELLFKAVFGSRSWLDLDQGIIDEAEAFHRMSATLSEYPEEIRFLLEHWDEMLVPMDASIKLLHRLKEQNLGLYLISNFHVRAYERVRRQYDFFRLFDGVLISSHVKLLKPDPVIYQRLMTNFSLTAADCLFVDDTPANVSGAQSVGMLGLVFQDAGQLETDLCSMGILKP